MLPNEADGFFQFGQIRRRELEKKVISINHGEIVQLIEGIGVAGKDSPVEVNAT